MRQVGYLQRSEPHKLTEYDGTYIILQILDVNFICISFKFSFWSGLIPSRLPTNIFYVFLISPLRTACPTHLVIFDMNSPIKRLISWRTQVLEQTSYFQYVPVQPCITVGHLIMRQLVWFHFPVCSLYFRRNVSHVRHRHLETVACVPKGA
jgi:hypothetical protein